MKRIVLCCLIFIYYQSFSQTKDELDLCMAIQGNSFSTNTAAENALNRILNTIGASKNFVLSPCDKINNAVATAYKGTRYILYDKVFMNLINRDTNDWSNLFVLAHEVGHHINGHSIDLLLYTSDIVEPKSLAKKREQELEADEFSAFVLAKLGATLSQLNSIVSLISDNSDDTYSTHPKRSKRLSSVRKGFNKGYVKKETKTIYVDSRARELDNSGRYTKIGDMYVYGSNDPFSEDNHILILGNLVGKNLNFEEAPNLKIEKSTYSSFISLGLNLSTIKPYIGNTRKTGNKTSDGYIFKGGLLNFQVLVVDSNNKTLFKKYMEKPLTQDLLRNLKDGKQLLLLLGSVKNLALKKGTRLLIRVVSFRDVDYTLNKIRMFEKVIKVNKNIDVFDDVYFEYSLSGSSKALAD